MVVSGVNTSANLGHDVTYSGTVTAAMEAAIWAIPAIAFSLDTPENGGSRQITAPPPMYAHQIVERGD